MKCKLSFLISFLFIIFIFNCSTPSDQLKSNNPELYNNIIGTWYILSPNKPGEIFAIITFNDDGTITGDAEKVFGFKQPGWTDKINTDNNNLKYYPGYIGIYNLSGNPGVKFIVPLKYDESNIAYNTLNKRSSGHPPLEINNFYKKYSSLKNLEFYIWLIPAGIDEIHLCTVYTKDKNLLTQIQHDLSTQNSDIKKKWDLVDKNSIKQHIDFINNCDDEEINELALQSMKLLMDKKINKYMVLKHKTYAKYLDYPVIFKDGTLVCNFIDFLRAPITGINYNTGEKWNIIFSKNTKYTDGFDLTLGETGKEGILSFKPYKNKLIIMGIKKDYLENPEGWQYAIATISEITKIYPAPKYVDVDLLEKL